MIVRDKNNSLSLLFAWSGTILPKVLGALLCVVLISTLLLYFSQQHLIHFPQVPAIGFTIFGVILSIFLSFRNNASYERWWEGRKLWGALIAHSRHISRDSQVLDAPARRVLMYRVMLFSHLLRDRLRREHQDFSSYTDHVNLNQAEFEALPSHLNAAQWVLEKIQADLVHQLKNRNISDIVYQGLTQHIVQLGNIQAGCDRIASTPLPFAYSVLLHRAVYVFCLILPFSLSQSLGLWTPLLVAMIAYLVLGLDALSAELEEPFGRQDNDLALDSIVRLVEREMRTALGDAIPAAITAQRDNLT
ncbi:bestrophin family protein [uncultured Acinetobacter sp.]|uniref:bestrophin family protein n=1 Tax=uncultured Acinetobacter sp. TaxID=165433 RepID=UPI002626F83E|nr:bestrophin family protein [uncultured Acinetobacter sp.]